uniref:RNA-directed DNA polymerase n=1 Tax=Haemonchus contortus TaxID=6289 RepID=A0A7I5EED3_HAECO
MSKVLGGLEGNVLTYIDDILVYNKHFESHLTTLEKVLLRLRQFNLKASPKKCVFARRQITFLGHLINKDSYSPAEANTRAVREFPTPTNTKEVKRFLGMVGFFRKFIPNFANIAEPLTRLTRKSKKFQWLEPQEAAFRELRDALINKPILGYPDYNKPFHIFTDASSVAQAGALMQEEQPGSNKFYAIAYCSRTLTETERRWPAVQIELGAIICALRQFKPYICMTQVTLHSDHKPLTFLLNKSKTHDNLARWLIELQSYNIKVVHIKGTKNTVADALSRVHEDQNAVAVPDQELQDIIDFPLSLQVQAELTEPPAPARGNRTFVRGSPELIDFRHEQQRDNFLRLVRLVKTDQPLPPSISDELRSKATAIALHTHLNIDGCMYYKPPKLGGTQSLLLVPQKFFRLLFDAHHSSALSGGHTSWKKTLAKLLRKYYWPTIHSDVRKWSEECLTCQMRRNPKPAFCERLIPVHSEAVFAKVGLDLCGPLKTTERGNKYILNMVCWFTRYVISTPLPDARANTIAHALLSDCVLKYGTMSELVSDQASSFTSHFYQEFCNLLHIQHRFATPYHSMGNGATERTFRTFQSMLSKFINLKQEDWDLFVPCVTFCYNTSVHEATGETPFFLMFGRDPVFTIDRILLPQTRPQIPGPSETDEYRAQLVSALHLAWKQAVEHARTYKQLMAAQYDKAARPSQIKAGDRVFFRNYTSKQGLARKLCFPWIGQFRVLSVDPPHATILSITSPQSKPRRVHLNQIKKVIDYSGPASTLPTIPEEETFLNAFPTDAISGHKHDLASTSPTTPQQALEGPTPPTRYNLRPRNHDR